MGQDGYEQLYNASRRVPHDTQGTHYEARGQPVQQSYNSSHAKAHSTVHAPRLLRTESAPATSSAGASSGTSHRSYRQQDELETDNHERRGRTLERGTEHGKFYPTSDGGGGFIDVNGQNVFVTGADLRGAIEQQRQMEREAGPLSVFGNNGEGTDGHHRHQTGSRYPKP